MGRFQFSVEIQAPLEKVFAFFADSGNVQKTAPEDTETKIEKLTEGPIGHGTTWRFSGVLGGRRFEVDAEYSEFKENRRVSFRQIKGELRKWDGTYLFEATDKGTRVTTTVEYELPYSALGVIMGKPTGFGKTLEGFYRANNEKANEILEHGWTPTGSI